MKTMKKQIQHGRCRTWWPVRWPMVYGTKDFVANGTVLDVTANEWRVAGPMPVLPGTRLRLQVCPPEKADPMEVGVANVLWVDGCELMVEVEGMKLTDHEWLNRFLDRARSQKGMAQVA